MLSLPAEDIQQRIFTATADLPEDMARIPLKTVHINKCPVLAPVSVIRPEDAQRLNVDFASCRANIDKIKAASGLADKLAAVFSGQNYVGQDNVDPDLAIYSGGFFSDNDKKQMVKIRLTPPKQLAKTTFKFTDGRLPEMLFRYRARNYPETLSADEQRRWNAFCVGRLTGHQAGAGILLDDYFRRLEELRGDKNLNIGIINDLHNYALDKITYLGIKNA
jgi:exodeoxyribonuclease-1